MLGAEMPMRYVRPRRKTPRCRIRKAVAEDGVECNVEEVRSEEEAEEEEEENR